MSNPIKKLRKRKAAAAVSIDTSQPAGRGDGDRIPLSALRPNDRNPRKIASDALTKLAESIALLQPGAACVVNIDDVRIGSRTYPLVSDTVQAAVASGFTVEPRLVFENPGKRSAKNERHHHRVWRRRARVGVSQARRVVSAGCSTRPL